jgi:hypothetical protein
MQGVKSLVNIDTNTCAHIPLTMQASLNEMVAIAQAAYSRTQNVYNLQAPNEEINVVFYTFHAYFATSNTPMYAFPPSQIKIFI